MEEKFKKELEAILNGAAVTNEKDKKKSADQKPKKEEKKVAEAKKDKKQIEDEERKSKELQDNMLAEEEEEKKAKRIQEFDREKELKHFESQRHSFDEESGKSEHSRFIIPLYYKQVVKEENRSSNNSNNNSNDSNKINNVNNKLDTSPEVYNYDGENTTGGFKANNLYSNNNYKNKNYNSANQNQAPAMVSEISNSNASKIHRNQQQSNLKMTFI